MDRVCAVVIGCDAMRGVIGSDRWTGTSQDTTQAEASTRGVRVCSSQSTERQSVTLCIGSDQQLESCCFVLDAAS